MSIKDRLAKLEAKLSPASVADQHTELRADMQYIFDNYGHNKIVQLADDFATGRLNDDDRELIKIIDGATPALLKEGGVIWLCGVLLKF